MATVSIPTWMSSSMPSGEEMPTACLVSVTEEISPSKIAAAGHPDVVVILVTNSDDYENLTIQTGACNVLDKVIQSHGGGLVSSVHPGAVHKVVFQYPAQIGAERVSACLADECRGGPQAGGRYSHIGV